MIYWRDFTVWRATDTIHMTYTIEWFPFLAGRSFHLQNTECVSQLVSPHPAICIQRRLRRIVAANRGRCRGPCSCFPSCLWWRGCIEWAIDLLDHAIETWIEAKGFTPFRRRFIDCPSLKDCVRYSRSSCRMFNASRRVDESAPSRCGFWVKWSPGLVRTKQSRS